MLKFYVSCKFDEYRLITLKFGYNSFIQPLLIPNIQGQTILSSKNSNFFFQISTWLKIS